jgi:rhamnosyltransferase
MKISIIIPTFNPGNGLIEVLSRLEALAPESKEILIIDSSSTDGTPDRVKSYGVKFYSIPQKHFNHGRTRNFGGGLATGDILVFMTQDALPIHDDFLTKLIEPITSGGAGASYARQIPYPSASVIESFSREFNYPSVSNTKSMDDAATLGVKTFFFSNVASAVLKTEFDQVGRFPENVIMNEDMMLCYKLLKSGQRVAYVADAEVFHSHNYSLAQTFKRYFDIGVFFSMHGSIFNVTPGGEGLNFVLGQFKSLIATRSFAALPRCASEILVKLIGYHSGRNHSFIPVRIKKKMSMHSFYWNG